MSGLAFVSRMISRATLMLAGVGLLAMTGIIGWQVFARYVLNASPAWAEQAALVLRP
jgi:TRAP-type C4-dicarboxylate transport system permease small subunit